MKRSCPFIRIVFTAISITFAMLYAAKTGGNIWLGGGYGLGFSVGLIALQIGLRRLKLQRLTVLMLGLFVGYLCGLVLNLLYDGFLSVTTLDAGPLAKPGLYLAGLYFGLILTVQGSDTLYLSIPFVRLRNKTAAGRTLLLAPSLLGDNRFLDLAATGLLDKLCVLPRFVVRDLEARGARAPLDVVRKLEALPGLHLRYDETDFADGHEISDKLIRLAKLSDADILTNDAIAQPTTDGVKIIPLPSLSKALKPLMQTGELLSIKIQRTGKEPQQGVGYLEDGTMVVVNGGGDFIGQGIRTRVLSVKHTAAGRMIFCNTMEEEDD